jgi:hypothetical protein
VSIFDALSVLYVKTDPFNDVIRAVAIEAETVFILVIDADVEKSVDSDAVDALIHVVEHDIADMFIKELDVTFKEENEADTAFNDPKEAEVPTVFVVVNTEQDAEVALRVVMEADTVDKEVALRIRKEALVERTFVKEAVSIVALKNDPQEL